MIIVVSDPSLPLGQPGTESKRIYAEQLVSATYNWDPTTPVSSIIGLKRNDFLIKDLRLSTPLINIPLVQLDVPNITVADKYAIDGVHGTYNTIGTPTYGILDIIGAFTKDNSSTTETITVKRINMSRGGSTVKKLSYYA